MNFTNLEYFLVTAEEGSFSRAAERLLVSQQSLSEMIRKMEQEYNVKLFERTRPLTLTYAGECLVNMASRILVYRNHIENLFSDIRKDVCGEFKFGINYSHGKVLLPLLLPIFKEKFPRISCCIIQGNQHYLERQLLHGEVDIVLGFNRFSSLEIKSIELLRDKAFIFVPDSIMRSLFGKEYKEKVKEYKKGVDLIHFADCPFLLTRPFCHIRRISDALFNRYGFKPNIVVEANDIDTLFLLCMESMGIVFYPRILMNGWTKELHNKAANSVHRFPLKDRHSEYSLLIGYHRDNHLNYSTKFFIMQLQEQIKSI